jgi:hypothetical protein
MGLILVGSPIFMSDVYGMLPSAMMFVVAIGPINALSSIQPTCLRCGCVVEPQAQKAPTSDG